MFRHYVNKFIILLVFYISMCVLAAIVFICNDIYYTYKLNIFEKQSFLFTCDLHNAYFYKSTSLNTVLYWPITLTGYILENLRMYKCIN